MRGIEDPPHDLPVPGYEGKRVWRNVHFNPAAAPTQPLLMNQRDDRLPPSTNSTSVASTSSHADSQRRQYARTPSWPW